MKRSIHVALAALMLLSVMLGAGAAPVAASSAHCDHTSEDGTHIDVDDDNDDFDIDDSENVIIDDSEDNDFIDLL